MILPYLLLTWFAILSCSSAENAMPYGKYSKETYIASTPANHIVKAFLGIPRLDSIDFIRWELSFTDSLYTLSCHYGIGKPNTRDFMKGGNKIHLSGQWQRQNNVVQLNHGNKILNLAKLNTNLLHIEDEVGNLMRGNGGWSYTLNKANPTISSDLIARSMSRILRDSMAFEGRSPCEIPGVSSEPNCLKLKWFIVLFADPISNLPTTYRAISAPLRSAGGKSGKWRVITGESNRVNYQLLNDNGSVFLNLIKPDDNVLLFADPQGRLLVGNEDFSYTVSRVF